MWTLGLQLVAIYVFLKVGKLGSCTTRYSCELQNMVLQLVHVFKNDTKVSGILKLT